MEQAKRDLVLSPYTYAYMSDVTKGIIKVYTGPTVINPTAQEMPVVYNPKGGTFVHAPSMEAAVCKAPIAVEGYYLVLFNPAMRGEHPQEGTTAPSPDLNVGRRMNIPGPVTFALWPGQHAQVVRGHHLRSNQYLLVRVYNEEEARKNWSKAVIKRTEPKGTGDQTGDQTSVTTTPAEAPVATGNVPDDLSVGKLYLIKGTEVSFYIPPTGITVVAEGVDSQEKPLYVRDALTLERLEYAILVDENGKKRYERGPQVVFPKPTERFVEDNKGSKKFRAVELNEIQGIHVKVIAPYEEGGKKYGEGEELFITGRDTAIYFPREEHSAVKYDGKAKHFATAVPAGEARYVMDRITGTIKTVKGPAMLLPDPRTEVIVRRVLSDRQVENWYPGNSEALAYNQGLRQILANAPTTRQGAISEGDYERNSRRMLRSNGLSAQGMAAYASSNAVMESSFVSGDQALVGEEFSRGSTYSTPRTVTLDTKYQGAPAIDVWTGYAVMVVNKRGNRRVEIGPCTILLEYDETLEVLELSTGKPKTTDSLLRTAFLRVENNKVSDMIRVETADHVLVECYVAYRVNFDMAQKDKWFSAENYVKLLCDHARSVLKGAGKRCKVETFYRDATDIIRDTLLGKPDDKHKRQGMVFTENGMSVTDIEVLGVKITDERIRGLLDQTQHAVVKSNIEVSELERNLEVMRRKEQIARDEAQAKADTVKEQNRLNIETAESTLKVALARLTTSLEEFTAAHKLDEVKQANMNFNYDADLARRKRALDQDEAIERQRAQRTIETLKEETEAIVKRFGASLPGFSEALLALSNNETMVKVAEAWSIQRAIGGESVSDALSRVFQNTPLAPLMQKLTTTIQAGKSNGNGTSAALPSRS